LLITVVLFCLLVLSVIIMIMISSRRKEHSGYNPGQMNGTRTSSTGIGDTGMGESVTGKNVTGSFDERLQKLIDQWRIIEAVKLVRETRNIGLKEAKDYINNFMRAEETEENTPSEGIIFESSEDDELSPEELDGKVFELLIKKKKIEAVKLVKENMNIGLKEAKDYVEEIEKRLNF